MAGQPPVQGPTRKDYEDEQARKAKAARDIEENVKHVREKQEREHRHEESERRGTTPTQIRKWKKQEPYKPHGTFGQTVAEKAKAGAAQGLKELMTPPPAKPKSAQRKSTRTGPPRLNPRTSAGQLGYFTPARPRKSTRRQPAQPSEFGALSFTGTGVGFSKGTIQRSELDFFTLKKKKKGRGGGSILDFTL